MEENNSNKGTYLQDNHISKYKKLAKYLFIQYSEPNAYKENNTLHYTS